MVQVRLFISCNLLFISCNFHPRRKYLVVGNGKSLFHMPARTLAGLGKALSSGWGTSGWDTSGCGISGWDTSGCGTSSRAWVILVRPVGKIKAAVQDQAKLEGSLPRKNRHCDKFAGGHKPTHLLLSLGPNETFNGPQQQPDKYLLAPHSGSLGDLAPFPLDDSTWPSLQLP